MTLSIRQFPLLVERHFFSPKVELEGRQWAVSAHASAAFGEAGKNTDQKGIDPLPSTDEGVLLDDDDDMLEVPLIRLAYARSGDKGDISNIGVMVRHIHFLPTLRAQLTESAVRIYLSHLVEGAVTRYELPGIDALNFVCQDALGGCGMASLRTDPLGKSMAQILLLMQTRVASRLLASFES